jgi:hypothetical protein
MFVAQPVLDATICKRSVMVNVPRRPTGASSETADD